MNLEVKENPTNKTLYVQQMKARAAWLCLDVTVALAKELRGSVSDVRLPSSRGLTKNMQSIISPTCLLSILYLLQIYILKVT